MPVLDIENGQTFSGLGIDDVSRKAVEQGQERADAEWKYPSLSVVAGDRIAVKLVTSASSGTATGMNVQMAPPQHMAQVFSERVELDTKMAQPRLWSWTGLRDTRDSSCRGSHRSFL